VIPKWRIYLRSIELIFVIELLIRADVMGVIVTGFEPHPIIPILQEPCLRFREVLLIGWIPPVIIASMESLWVIRWGWVLDCLAVPGAVVEIWL